MSLPMSLSGNGGPLADWQIRERRCLGAGDPKHMVIFPFAEACGDPGIVGYGLSSYGYDLRLANEFCILDDSVNSHLPIDPADFDGDRFHRYTGDTLIVPPNSFCLARSLEHLRVPEDCLAIVMGKSTYARCGIALPMTPLEPGWEGTVTLEISNDTRLPVRLRAGHGIAQVVFLQGSGYTQVPYNRKKGARYQGQRGITLPRVS